jgi:hypothetical protein
MQGEVGEAAAAETDRDCDRVQRARPRRRRHSIPAGVDGTYDFL